MIIENIKLDYSLTPLRDAPNISEVLNEIKTKIEGERVVGYIGSSSTNLVDIAFLCSDPKIEEDHLFFNIKILDTPKGLILKEYIGATWYSKSRFSPEGIGVVDIDKNIRGYNLQRIVFRNYWE